MSKQEVNLTWERLGLIAFRFVECRAKNHRRVGCVISIDLEKKKDGKTAVVLGKINYHDTNA